MLYSYLFVVPVAIAQLAGLPPCAESCYSLASSPDVAACIALWSTSYDAAATCACQDMALIQAVADCGASVCPPDTVEEVYQALANICQGENVTIPHTITASSSTIDTIIVPQTASSVRLSAPSTTNALSSSTKQSKTQSTTSSSTKTLTSSTPTSTAETSKNTGTSAGVVQVAKHSWWYLRGHLVLVGLFVGIS